jgi:glycerol-3-phosphate acyltransferase PlsX
VAAPLLIAVDVMSGDHGPRVCVPAALAALSSDPRPTLALCGEPAHIEAALAGVAAALRARVRIVPASQVVAMDEPPREAIRRKKDSSMRRAIDLVAAGEAAACVSAGNTGALMAMAHFVLGMIAGIERPAILSAIPAEGGHTLMLDLGANNDASAEQLRQFALMGSVVARDVHGIQRPRIAVLNIGEEDIKGHARVQDAHRLLLAAGLNYLGFIEGDGIFTGVADVVVTDGFTGNVALKTMEGLARMIGGALRDEFTRTPLRRLAALAALPALGALKARLDPRRYNGASMVGLAGIVVKSHGGADETAFANAVRTGIVEAAQGVPARIRAQLVAQAA